MMVVMRSLIVMGLVPWAVQLVRWLIVVTLITGCGRIGFDSFDDETGADNGPGVDGGNGTTGSSDDAAVGDASNAHYITGGTAARVGGATSITTMTGALTDSDMVLVVAIHWRDTVSSVTTVQDTFGNGFSMAGGMRRYNGAQSQVMWFKKVTAGTAINVFFDQAASAIDLKWAAYRDIDQTVPIGPSISASGTGTTADSGALSLTSDAVLVAASGSRAQTATAGPGFVERHRSAGGVLEDVETGPGAYNATVTLDTSSEWIIQMVALRPR